MWHDDDVDDDDDDDNNNNKIQIMCVFVKYTSHEKEA